jgi:putative protein-disulfide isomerase
MAIGTFPSLQVQIAMQTEPRMSGDIQLIYIHDPMCSWCWGFRPRFEELLDRLPSQVAVGRLLGGLAPDNDEPMPVEMQQYLQDTWHRIAERIPGTRFHFRFWELCQPRRSTWPACRAVIAARRLHPTMELAMIDAIQRAYYLEARNPSDTGTLVALAEHLGLDGGRFAALLDAPETRNALNNEISCARSMGADSFPSLRLRIAESHWPVPVDYQRTDPMLDTIRGLIDLHAP